MSGASPRLAEQQFGKYPEQQQKGEDYENPRTSHVTTVKQI